MDIHWLLFVRYLEFFAKFQGSRKQRQQTSLSMSFAHSSTRDVSLRRGYMRVCKTPEYVRICESYVHNGAKLQKRTNICKFLCKKIIKNLHFKRKIETFAGKVSICMNQIPGITGRPELDPTNVAEVHTVGQELVLRIHTQTEFHTTRIIQLIRVFEE